MWRGWHIIEIRVCERSVLRLSKLTDTDFNCVLSTTSPHTTRVRIWHPCASVEKKLQNCFSKTKCGNGTRITYSNVSQWFINKIESGHKCRVHVKYTEEKLFYTVQYFLISSLQIHVLFRNWLLYSDYNIQMLFIHAETVWKDFNCTYFCSNLLSLSNILWVRKYVTKITKLCTVWYIW